MDSIAPASILAVSMTSTSTITCCFQLVEAFRTLLKQTCTLGMSTPLKKCIGSPEQKYISDAGKKASELGAFSSGIRLGWDYPPACPSWHGVSGACSACTAPGSSTKLCGQATSRAKAR